MGANQVCAEGAEVTLAGMSLTQSDQTQLPRMESH